jgi:hypothetical protein
MGKGKGKINFYIFSLANKNTLLIRFISKAKKLHKVAYHKALIFFL